MQTKDLIVHETIADLYRSLDLPFLKEAEFDIHFLPDIHPELPFKSPVFRAEYFSFVFVKDAHGSYRTDSYTFPFKPNTIYFTNPGHVKAFEFQKLTDAYIITLTESFLRKNVHPDIFGEFPFLLAETMEPWHLSDWEFEEMEALYLQVHREFQKDTIYKDRILGNLFVVLLLKIKERYCANYCPIDEGDRNSQIVRSFKRLIEQKFKGLTADEAIYNFHVQDYADSLNLHPNYLNNVIKSKTGKTVNDWITKRLTSTAMVLLKNTNFTSKEIGLKLGFSQPTHFSRFFKKQTGFSPVAYKKSSV